MAVMLSCMVCTSHAEYEILVTDTGTNESCLYGINTQGYAAGFTMVNGQSMPWMITPELGQIILPALPAGSTQHGIGYGVDDNYNVGGSYGGYFNATSPFRINNGIGCVWKWNGSVFTPIEFGSRPTTIRSMNNGWFAGQQSPGDTGFTDNAYTYFGFGTGNPSFLNGVNALGDATGYGSPANTTMIPMFVKNNGSGYSVTYAPGPYNWNAYSSGTAINVHDEIVGVNATSGFYWNTSNNAVQFFGNVCYGISDSGTIVGNLNGHAHQWKKVNGIYVGTDLNTLISDTNLVLETAFGINASGRIVGRCFDKKQNAFHGFMLVPATPVGMSLRPDSPGYARLRWQSQANRDYSIRISTDLKHWVTYPGVYESTDSTANVLVPTDEAKLFLRVFDVTP